MNKKPSTGRVEGFTFVNSINYRTESDDRVYQYLYW